MNAIITVLPFLQITLSILIVIAVLLQQRGSEVGGAFGGGGGGGVYSTKRGLEKILFRATIVLGVLFAVVSLLRVLL